MRKVYVVSLATGHDLVAQLLTLFLTGIHTCTAPHAPGQPASLWTFVVRYDKDGYEEYEVPSTRMTQQPPE